MRGIALLLGLLVLLAGCSSLAKLNELGTALEAEGYQVTSLNHNSSPAGSVLSVQLVAPGEAATEDDAAGVAEVVWTEFDGDFDRLEVIINARPLLTATADELTERFGERPAGLAEDKGDGMNVTALVILLAIAAAFVALMIWIWHRGRRPPPPVAPPGQYYYGPYTGPSPPR